MWEITLSTWHLQLTRVKATCRAHEIRGQGPQKRFYRSRRPGRRLRWGKHQREPQPTLIKVLDERGRVGKTDQRGPSRYLSLCFLPSSVCFLIFLNDVQLIFEKRTKDRPRMSLLNIVRNQKSSRKFIFTDIWRNAVQHLEGQGHRPRSHRTPRWLCTVPS